MMASPLEKLKNSKQSGMVEVASTPQQTIPVASAKSSPLAKVSQKPAPLMPNTVVSDNDIEKLGADLSRNVGATTEKIIQKMGVGKFDELGKILVEVQAEANKLDPASIQKGGIIGWFQNKFGDVKQELTLRLKNADAVFDNLSTKISNHIAVHVEWIKDLESLYQENYQRYQNIVATMQQGEQWKAALQAQIDSWPTIAADDPDAQMKIQAKRDAESRLNRIQIKLDSFLRLKTISESNAPKIKAQQETSRTTVMTLKDVVEQTIPMIKWEFSLYLQSLDAQKSIKLVNSAKTLANTTLVKSADSAKQSAVDAATALNSPVVDTETINHIRIRMIETLDEVKAIESNARSVREADAKTIADSQAQYLSRLQQSSASVGATHTGPK